MKLIDKSALVAEIERRIKSLHQVNSPREQAVLYECEDILSFINTLEVKEVDLKKELQSFFYPHVPWGDYCKNEQEDIEEWSFKIAKHFFELGLKAQHDNWKVVDNTNLPQGDRTKIYCVFTKQRYILATVINRPQDEDLLQWKCTEFPHHLYDMCEGDKYMQIV